MVYADDVNRGVPDVLVRAVAKTASASTDSTGSFSFAPAVSAGEFLQISLSKPGFNEVVTTLTVRSGANSLAAAVHLSRQDRSGGSGGAAASTIVLKSVSSSSIGVRGAGSNETALLASRRAMRKACPWTSAIVRRSSLR